MYNINIKYVIANDIACVNQQSKALDNAPKIEITIWRTAQVYWFAS
jgi:hypothetical protein